MLEYALGDERSFVWAVSRTGFACVELPPRREIEASARRVHELLAEPARRVKFETAEERATRLGRAEAKFAVESARLSGMLLGPVAGQLGTKRLLVVPDGALQYVPFAALPDPRRTGGAPLVLAHEIVTIPSATALAVLRRDLDRRARAPKALAVVADPVFTRDDPRLAGVPAAATVVASAAGPRSRAVEEGVEGVGAGEIPRLEFSRREAQAIVGLVPAADLLQALDFDANRSTLMGGSLGDFRIVHIATHGFLNGSNPALSGLLLSKVDAKGQPRDGLVLSHEIYGMNLSADLVVLSACRTGLGKDVRGEGIIGLTRGFMYAGARRVVVSLWSVDDQATAELMGRFYESMLRGRRPPAAALRTAQVAMWNEGKYRFPYYWAAFVVQGEWR